VLGGRKPSAVIASPLLRARQTAQPVAERAGLVVSTDECLLDRDYGPWTGVSRDSVTSRWGFSMLEWRDGSWTVLSVNERPAEPSDTPPGRR
jgi:probable phosphoglycerate mutase